jgi:hypothetical protein
VSRATRARIEVRIKRQAKVLENTTIERRRINDDTLPVTRQIADQSRLNRSRVTNGTELLPGLDGRSLLARRFRDLIAQHTMDLGGESNVSQAQLSLIRRAAALTVELERWETRFADDDGAKPLALDQYQRCLNSLRRVLESLGLERKSRDITPEIVAKVRKGEL